MKRSVILLVLSIGLGGVFMPGHWAEAAGNELSISPEQPASPDQWWLRSLKDGSDVTYSKFRSKVVF